MRRVTPIVLLAVLAGCGGSESAVRDASPPGVQLSCHTSVGSVRLDAAPAVLPRGTADTLSIDWEMDSGVSVPVLAHLSTGPNYSIELTTPLTGRPGQYGVYGVDLVNPFGTGTPTGFVSVYVWLGVPTDCPPPLDATTTFDLN